MKPLLHTCRHAAAMAALLFGLSNVVAYAAGSGATLSLTLVDEASGTPTPARVEVRDAAGEFHVADDAVRFGGDCDMSDAGAGYDDLPTTLAAFTDRLRNPYTETTQFYSAGTSTLTLAPGSYTLTAVKGPEYETASATITIAPGANSHTLSLTRWINMPASGWYSADDHLHIPRPDKALNPLIMTMMQAEDVHVANLLQMGKVRNFTIAPQYAHGARGHYQEGHFILAAGQENPRTHFLGHTITLGADKTMHKPDNYLIYRLLWEESVAHGGINGFAHAWADAGIVAPQDGMAVVLPHNLLHFVEVVQFNRSGYENLYDILGLGFRVAPTAGTDYPCAQQNIPGHERFYTRVEGELTYDKWIDAIRAGRTFATTGPIVEFNISGQDIGGEVVLDTAGTLEIRGAIHFNPVRDDVQAVELVQNGTVIHRFSRVEGARTIEFKVSRQVAESSWFAVRGYGNELWPTFGPQPMHMGSLSPTSNVHSGAIYVTVKDAPALTATPGARMLARSWLARLENLEYLLAETNLDTLSAQLVAPDFDAVPPEVLASNRSALLREIANAKRYFRRLTGE